jgi:hypothetical protein
MAAQLARLPNPFLEINRPTRKRNPTKRLSTRKATTRNSNRKGKR